MSLPQFYDYNPSNPWVITDESHTIALNGTVRLTYIPLKGSVSIPGYTETTSVTPGLTEFYIDYQDATAYRTAQGVIQFNVSAASSNILVSYQGVSQLLLATYMNEIKAYIDASVASQLATARTISFTDDATGSFSFDGSSDESCSLTLADSGVTAGTYYGITLDSRGIATGTSDVVWTEKFYLEKPADGYVSGALPLSRNGTLSNILFCPQGTPSSATSVYVFKGQEIALATALSSSATSITTNVIMSGTTPFYAAIGSEVVQVTNISGTTITIIRGQLGSTAVEHESGSVVMPTIGNISLSSSVMSTLALGSVDGNSRDRFCYAVSGGGLSDVSTSITQEWVNRT